MDARIEQPAVVLPVVSYAIDLLRSLCSATSARISIATASNASTQPILNARRTGSRAYVAFIADD
jgi:hypothetical protein